ncbi:MAG: polysaccharide biosynthesis/export family protein [Polaromonas sp.]|nr:polysaccharide biosynthesis/export family protein [Polaromonas sp.]
MPALMLAALLLSGCAAAPGMYIRAAMGSLTGAPPAKTATEDTASADAPPPGALLTITPELIRQQRALQKSELGADVQRLFGQAKPYGIGPGDIVDVVVWNHPEVSAPAGFNVSPDGLIQFPLLGTFKIAGLTENQARDQLTRRLAKFLTDPNLTVRVKEYRAGGVYMDGEVGKPGLQAVNDIPMTLPEAIGRAGGLTATADRASVAVTRNGVTTLVNLPQLTELGVNPSRIMLAAGDLVSVGNRDESKVYVLGEVTRPMALPLRSGRLTLNEALGESGGVSSLSGDPRQIYVVRSRNGRHGSTANAGAAAVTPTTPEIYHLDASSPVAYALSEGFELRARDVVFVDPVPLVRWNRVISLILPSAAGITTTRALTN